MSKANFVEGMEETSAHLHHEEKPAGQEGRHEALSRMGRRKGSDMFVGHGRTMCNVLLRQKESSLW